MRLSALVLLLLFGLAGPSHSQNLYDLLNTPRTDPCALFGGNEDVVTFYIDMDLEGGEVEMRVPKIFLEDRFDHEDGVRHGSQLFRVMIDNFLPVTRRQTSEFNKAGTWERGKPRYMWFLVGDYVDLEKTAELYLKWMSPSSPVNGGVKSGHWGGAKVGQFVECALGRVATNQQARSKAHWPSGRLFSCQVEGLAIRARL